MDNFWKGVTKNEVKALVELNKKFEEKKELESLSNDELYRQIKKKEVKSETEESFLKSYKSLAIISEILVGESKLQYSSEDAIEKIRKCLQNNL